MSTFGIKKISLNANEIKCQICNRTFKRLKDLKSHSVIHIDVKPFKCTVCQEAFKHKASLKRHSLIHSGEKPFGCKICGKHFRQKGSLNEHLLTHTGEKPHTCDICNLGFTTRSNYSRHARSHSSVKEKPHLKSNLLASTKTILKSHSSTSAKPCLNLLKSLEKSENGTTSLPVFVTKDKVIYNPQNLTSSETQCDIIAGPTILLTPDSKSKLHPCKICNAEFIEYNSLEIHSLSHINEKKYKCDLCSKSFAKFSAFCNHKITHICEKLTCIICGDTFNTIGDLQKHLEMHANILSKSIAFIKNPDFITPDEPGTENALLKNFMCKVCNDTFREEVVFLQHSLIHKHPGPFICDTCGDKVKCNNLKEMHEHYSLHDDVPCICFICNKSSSEIEFQDYESFKCDECHKCFIDKNILKIHTSFHKKRRPCLIKLQI